MKKITLSSKIKNLAKKYVLYLTSIIVSISVIIISESRIWQAIENRAFDSLTVITSPNEQITPIIIVGIDDHSISTMEIPWPWPRGIHAELIKSLNIAGAGAIVFDVIFENPSDPEQDAELINAIKQAGNVILAAGEVMEESAYGTLKRRQNPMQELVIAGAKVGLVSVVLDNDHIVRHIPQSPDSLWRVALHELQLHVPELAVDFLPAKSSYIRYLGPPRTFTYLSYIEALEMASQPKVLENALILVGRVTASAVDISSAQADTFITPMSWETGSIMNGVEIHATIMENAILSQFIVPAHPFVNWLIICLLTFGAIFSLSRKKQSIGAVISLLWFMVIIAVIFGLWKFQQIFLPPIALILIPIAIFISRGAILAHQERENRLALKRTFSLYLEEAVVNEIAAHPEKVELGGQQREITLLFSDLKDFTPLSERLSPRQLANLLNDYFELMTQAVFQNGGTLDKFIGDAVMAFWGAPLDQEDHPIRAVSCARDMLKALEEFNLKQQEKEQPTLQMRIGVHTGVALVGNLGCPSRFSYTALGDSVNLAARLESANKNHGTKVLISAETVKHLPDHFNTKYVDEIKVKGRQQSVKVYTLV